MTDYEQSPDYRLIFLGALIVAFVVLGGQSQATAQQITPEQYHQQIGPCACPGNKTADGHRCGRVSAYCRCGGWEPTCFAGDDTGQREPNRQHRCGHVCALYGR
jgi:hypothetical protein